MIHNHNMVDASSSRICFYVCKAIGLCHVNIKVRHKFRKFSSIFDNNLSPEQHNF